MRRRILETMRAGGACIALAVLLFLIVPAADAALPILVSNMGNADFDVDLAGGAAPRRVAQSFTTGTSGATLGKATLHMYGAAPVSANQGGFAVKLLSDASGTPGTELLTLSGSSTPHPGCNYDYGAQNYALAANTTYWLLAEAPTTSSYYWYFTNNASETEAEAGWTIGNTYSRSDNGGAWDVRPWVFKVSLSTDAPAEPPAITGGAPLTRGRDAGSSSGLIATASDPDTPEQNLIVTAAPPTGITVNNIVVDSSGNVTANVAADGSAALGAKTVVLTVADGGCVTASANLTVNVVAYAPGGVITNAGMWVKADSGTYTDTAGTTAATNGQNVQHWHDQWTRSVHVKQASSSISPNLATAQSSFNFNPVLDFNASDQLNSDANVSPFTAQANNSDVFVVMNYAGTYADLVGLNGTAADTTDGTRKGDWPEWTVFVNPYVWTYYGIPSGTPATGTVPVSQNQTALVDYLSTHTSGSNGTFAFTVNGRDSGSGPLNVDLGLYNVQVAENGGDNSANTNENIAEIVMYNANLTTGQRNQVRSYLATKYGLTLGTTAATVDYTASDGATVFWTGNATYQNDVAGTGRDDTATLDQRVSHSVNTGTQPTFANGASLQTTNPGTNTALSADRSFVMWGHNGAATAITTAVTAPGVTHRMARVWRTQLTGSGAAAQMTVQIADSVFGGLYSPRLLVSTDPTFGTVTRSPLALTCASGTCSATFDTFTAGEYFTFAASTSAPTNATLVQFSAKYDRKKGGVMVKWTTGNEVNVVGFHVWRKVADRALNTAQWRMANGKMIAAKALGKIEGAKYAFRDKRARAGKRYAYKLEILTGEGTSLWSEIRRVKK